MSTEISQILLIEDNPGDVRLIEECLRSRGIKYQLTRCETIDTAIRIVNSYGTNGAEIPDLMLLDYNVPRGDACAVLEAAAGNPALAHTRKAVITSSIAPKDQQDALRSGADAFIYKPADLDSFLGEVGGRIAELLESPRIPPR
ncbi:MAG TPA: response regulator [Bryobacteraceae bacterium]|nr:response regulator [Bryobacteraceae bacterium]